MKVFPLLLRADSLIFGPRIAKAAVGKAPARQVDSPGAEGRRQDGMQASELQAGSIEAVQQQHRRRGPVNYNPVSFEMS